MKNLISKKLALLAIVFFASIGHAFGYSIDVTLTNANNTNERVNAEVQLFGSYNNEWWVTNHDEITYSAGDDVTMQVYVRSSLYSIETIIVDEEDLTTDIINNGNSYTFSSLSEDHTVSVVFKKQDSQNIVVTLSHPDVMNLSFNSSNYWNSIRTSQTVEVPDGKYLGIGFSYLSTAYSIKSVIIDGEEKTEQFLEDHGFYFENISASHIVNITLNELPSHTIRVTPPDNTWPTVYFKDGDTRIYGYEVVLAAGRPVKMYIDPPVGQKADKVYVEGKNGIINVADAINTNGYYEFTALNADYEVSITFKQATTYTITVNYDNTKGWVNYVRDESSYGFTPNTPTKFNEGITVGYIANGDEGYRMSSFVVDGDDKTSDFLENDYYEFRNLSANHTIDITFEELPTITVNFDRSQGWVDMSNYGSISSGAQYETFNGFGGIITPYPGEYYTVYMITLDGENITDSYLRNGYIEVGNLSSGDHVVNVTFKEKPTITVYYNGEWGSVGIDDGKDEWYAPPSESLHFTSGTSFKLLVTPYDEYKIGSIYVDGENVTTSYTEDGYDITLTSSISVTVSFEEAEEYSIPVSVNYVDAEENSIPVPCESQYGQVYLVGSYGNQYSPDSNPTFREGLDVMLKIKPELGYTATVKVDGESVMLTYEPLYNGTYTYLLSNLKSGHSIEVTFKEVETATIFMEYRQSQFENITLNNWGFSSGSCVDFAVGTTVKLQFRLKIGYEVVSVLAGNKVLSGSLNEDGYYVYEFEVTDDCTLTVNAQKKAAPATVTATIPNSGVGTYCSEYDLNFTNAVGIMAYVASGFDPTNNQIVLTRVNEVPAGTGLVIKGTPGNHDISTRSTNYIYANMLNGVVEETQIWENWMTSWAGNGYYVNYVLDDSGEFNLVEDGYQLPANSAYLTIPQNYIENSSAKIHTIFLDDEEEINGITTGVGFIWAGEKRNATATDNVYNLQGQKVNSKTLKPGIYIKNGKKFMVK